MKNKKDGYIVKYKNNLAETRYSLKIQEQRLLLELVSKIHKDDEDFKEYEISIKDFMEDFNLKSHNLYGQLDKMSDKMLKLIMKVVVEPDNPNSRINKFTWFHRFDLIPQTGKIAIRLHNDMKPYFLNFIGHFAQYDIRNIFYMKSSYQIRLFELLKTWEYQGGGEIKLDELRERFEIPKSYDYTKIKTRIVGPLQEFCAKNCDMTFEFEEEKSGRSVYLLRFTIFKREQEFKKVIKQVIKTNQNNTNTIDPEWAQLSNNEKRAKLLGKRSSCVLYYNDLSDNDKKTINEYLPTTYIAQSFDEAKEWLVKKIKALKD